MKKMLIVNNNLEVGGVQTSLINFIKAHKDEYEITLLLFYGSKLTRKRASELHKLGVNIVYGRGAIRALGCSQKQTENVSKGLGLLRGVCALWTKIFSNRLPIKILTNDRKTIKLVNELGEFDLAISYLHGAGPKQLYGGCNEFVLKHVKAKKKVTFVHCDYEHYEGRTKYNANIASKFDAIVCCSNSCKDRFVSAVKSLINKDVSDKTFVVHNLIDFDYIKKCIEEYDREHDECIYDHDYFNILTVARLSEEKGLKEGIIAFNKAYKNGLFDNLRKNVRWHIVGGGHLEKELKDLVIDFGLKDVIIFHGEQKNPYPYFREADVVLMTSLHEAAPMIFGEASFFYVSVVTTNTTSAKELVEDRYRGVVCDSYEDLMKAVAEYDQDNFINCQIAMLETKWDNEKAILEWENVVLE